MWIPKRSGRYEDLRCTWELINEWTYEFPGLEGTWKVIFLYFDEI